MNRKYYIKILADRDREIMERKIKFIKRVPIFSVIPNYFLISISEFFVEESFKRKEVVFKEG